MAYSLGSACMILHHHVHSPLIISRSSACHRQIKPSFKFVCRAQNQPPISNGDNEGVSRRSFVDGALIVGSAAIGSVALGGAAFGVGDDSDPFQNLGKSEWPELVGKKAEVAVATIEKENPKVKAIVITPDITFVDLMFNTGRVRVFVDEKGVVTRVPWIG